MSGTGTYLDDLEKRDAQATARIARNVERGSEDLAAYFRALRTADVTMPEVVRTLRRRSQPVPAAEKRLGIGIRRALKRLRESGWERVELHFSEVDVTDEYYAADSKTKPGQEVPEHRRGELKTPAHRERFWWVLAVHKPARAAVRLGWKEKVTPAGKPSFTFDTAMCADPVGMPFELHADYSPSANDLRRSKDELEKWYQRRVDDVQQRAAQRDLAYNDSTAHVRRQFVLAAWRDVDVWIEEVNTIITRINERTLAA